MVLWDIPLEPPRQTITINAFCFLKNGGVLQVDAIYNDVALVEASKQMAN